MVIRASLSCDITKWSFSVSQFSHSVVSDSATPWTAAHQACLSITSSQCSLKLMSIESVMPSNHLIILGTYLPGEFVICCPVFLPFHTVQGFSRQEHWRGLPSPSPVAVLSGLSTMSLPSWVAPHGVAPSFSELDKAVVMWSDWLVFCDCGFQFGHSLNEWLIHIDSLWMNDSFTGKMNIECVNRLHISHWDYEWTQYDLALQGSHRL